MVRGENDNFYRMNAMSQDTSSLADIVKKLENRINNIELSNANSTKINPLYHKIRKAFVDIDGINGVEVQYEISLILLKVKMDVDKNVKTEESLVNAFEDIEDTYSNLYFQLKTYYSKDGFDKRVDNQSVYIYFN